MELISKLGIDWKLLLAQLVNFAVLLFILYKLVYHPVLKMLRDRQARIETGLENSKKGEALLKQVEEIEKKRMNEAEKRVGELLAKASIDAERMKAEILKEAQTQAEALMTRAKLQTEEMKANIAQEVKKEMGRLLIVTLAKVLEREFSEADQKRLEQAIFNEMKSL